MKLQVLGCSGGIGGTRRTSCFLLDEDILLDAGTGVGDLSLQALTQIHHIFISHSHLDHILGIPLLADSVQSSRTAPICVYALPETLQTLRQHIFNWQVWPDFTRLPTAEAPCLKFVELAVGQSVRLGGRSITPLPVHHAVSGVGYLLDSGVSMLAYSGDTTSHPPFWQALNAAERLDTLIIETAFSNQDSALAWEAKHYCPQRLAADLALLHSQPQVYITHLKPGQETQIMTELSQYPACHSAQALTQGAVLEF